MNTRRIAKPANEGIRTQALSNQELFSQTFLPFRTQGPKVTVLGTKFPKVEILNMIILSPGRSQVRNRVLRCPVPARHEVDQRQGQRQGLEAVGQRPQLRHRPLRLLLPRVGHLGGQQPEPGFTFVWFQFVISVKMRFTSA